jgi:hypothetical protein
LEREPNSFAEGQSRKVPGQSRKVRVQNRKVRGQNRKEPGQSKKVPGQNMMELVAHRSLKKKNLFEFI